MSLSAGQYSMQCWHSTRNPDEMNRPRLLHQCLQLIKSLQAHFTNNEIAIPSRDIKDTRKGIEICILYRPERNLFDDIASFLSRTASEKSLDYQDFVKQDAGITRYFNDTEMQNISTLAKPVPGNLSEADLAKVGDSVKEYDGFKMNDAWKNSIPGDQRTIPIQITKTALRRLHEKEGDELRAEINNLMNGIQAAKDETKTAWQVIMMLAKGALYVGGIGVVGTAIAGTVYGIIIVAAVIGVGVAAAMAGILLAGLAVFCFAGYLAIKDARNVLLVANESSSDILPLGNHIGNGERKLVPEMIPAATPNADLVWGGFFVYEKYKVGGQAFGSYGSAFGVSFLGGQGEFSIGMDCPNSFMGGNNSIEVCTGNDPQRACKMALDSGCLHGWTDNPRVDVKIADKWGNVNWGRAIVMGR